MIKQPPEQNSTLRLCYNAMVDKKAEEVLVLDLRGITNIADYFMICHGSSVRQVQAITDNVEKALRKSGNKRYHVEGKAKGNWVLMDLHDLVIHVFHKSARGLYSLERLWSDARRFNAGDIMAMGS
ncbi:MAG: ribosome silencing factor [Nitrospinota bacterium]